MNNKQKEIITKGFPITKDFTLTRNDFESFPCSMVACNWTDEQMEKLAQEIRKIFDYDTYPTTQNEIDSLQDEFYCAIEKAALNLGMKYYEDLNEEEYKEIKEFWNNIK